MGYDGMADVLSFLSARSADAPSELRVRSCEQEEAEQPGSSPAHLVEPTDEVLFAEMNTGSKEALALLFRRHRRAVLSVAKRILRDESEAEDLCQEVFLLLFQRAKLFHAKRGSASSWIIQIAYHRAMNRRQYLTHRQHYQSPEIDAEQIGTSRPLLVEGIAARALLERLRDQLTPDQQKTLELFFFEGYSLREIAEKMNQSLGNVRHHYYRALERLRSSVFPRENP
jgi:RNA polymerase sigma-70 factor (ECF subfamily)